MRADNSPALVDNARKRAQATAHRAAQILADAEGRHETVSVVEFARRARVSRSWVYSQPEIVERLQQLNAATTTETDGTVRAPASIRASDESLLRRLELAHQRILALTEKNISFAISSLERWANSGPRESEFEVLRHIDAPRVGVTACCGVRRLLPRLVKSVRSA